MALVANSNARNINDGSQAFTRSDIPSSIAAPLVRWEQASVMALLDNNVCNGNAAVFGVIQLADGSCNLTNFKGFHLCMTGRL
jgi:hypothetical protein